MCSAIRWFKCKLKPPKKRIISHVPEKHAKREREKLKFNLLLTFINNWLCGELLLVRFRCCWLGGCRKHWCVVFSVILSFAFKLVICKTKTEPSDSV